MTLGNRVESLHRFASCVQSLSFGEETLWLAGKSYMYFWENGMLTIYSEQGDYVSVESSIAKAHFKKIRF